MPLARFGAIICLSLLWALPLAAARAEDATSQAVVDIDVTAVDATAAREKALSDAPAQAFAKLLDEQVTDAAKRAAIKLSPAEIGKMVQGIEVPEEKISTGRYHAKIKVSFDPAKLRRALGSGGNSLPEDAVAAATPAASILVLPLWREGENSWLWEPSNPWFNSWKNAALQIGKGRLVVPPGEMTDKMALSTGQAITADYGRIKPLADRYGANAMILVEALGPLDPTHPLKVMVRHITPGGKTDAVLVVDAQPNATPEQFMAYAATKVAGQLVGGGERKKAEIAPAGKVTLLAKIGRVSDWIVLRKKLKTLPMVKAVMLSAISETQADMVVQYEGDAEALARGVSGLGFKLTKADGYWAIGN